MGGGCVTAAVPLAAVPLGGWPSQPFSSWRMMQVGSSLFDDDGQVGERSGPSFRAARAKALLPGAPRVARAARWSSRPGRRVAGSPGWGGESLVRRGGRVAGSPGWGGESLARCGDLPSSRAPRQVAPARRMMVQVGDHSGASLFDDEAWLERGGLCARGARRVPGARLARCEGSGASEGERREGGNGARGGCSCARSCAARALFAGRRWCAGTARWAAVAFDVGAPGPRGERAVAFRVSTKGCAVTPADHGSESPGSFQAVDVPDLATRDCAPRQGATPGGMPGEGTLH